MSATTTYTAIEWCRHHGTFPMGLDTAAQVLRTIAPLARQRARPGCERDRACVDAAERTARIALAGHTQERRA